MGLFSNYIFHPSGIISCFLLWAFISCPFFFLITFLLIPQLFLHCMIIFAFFKNISGFQVYQRHSVNLEKTLSLTLSFKLREKSWKCHPWEPKGSNQPMFFILLSGVWTTRYCRQLATSEKYLEIKLPDFFSDEAFEVVNCIL